jgi:hypothetical protein
MTVLLMLGTAFPAAAFVQSGQLGETPFTVYAPDWTWQKRDINILVVFENPTEEPVERTVELVVPEEFRDYFGHKGAAGFDVEVLTRTVTVPPNETARTAITGITALEGFPLQRYPLALQIAGEGGAQPQNVTFELQTIRGAVVNPGKWALYLPVAVALAFCLVFALLISRFAERGAWKRPSAPVTTTSDVPDWVDQEP